MTKEHPAPHNIALRCRTHTAQILYCVDGDLALPIGEERMRLRRAYGAEGWFKLANRRRLRPQPTVAELAVTLTPPPALAHLLAPAAEPEGEALADEPPGRITGAECVLYRQAGGVRSEADVISVPPGSTVRVVGVREGLADSDVLVLRRPSLQAPVEVWVEVKQSSSGALAQPRGGQMREASRKKAAGGAAGAAGVCNVAVMLLNRKRQGTTEVFVYQRGGGCHSSHAALAHDGSLLECFVWSPVTPTERAADAAASAVRTFTGEQVRGGESGPQHVLDREVPGAGTVSVFQVFLPALPQGEGAWGGGGGGRAGEGPCFGRFVPVRSLLLLAKPGITAEHLGSLAESLRLAPRLIEELSQKVDPLNAHLPPESRSSMTREGLSLARAPHLGADWFGSPALENAFPFAVRVSLGRPRAKSGQLVVALQHVRPAVTTPAMIFELVAKASECDARPAGIPTQRMRFAHTPLLYCGAPHRSQNGASHDPSRQLPELYLSHYGIEARKESDVLYAVLEAPRLNTSSLVLLEILFRESVLCLSDGHAVPARVPAAAAAASRDKAVEEEEEEAEPTGGALQGRWNRAANRQKAELGESWKVLKAQAKVASRSAEAHASRARFFETLIMDRSADLLQAVHVGGAGAARTLKVIGDALQVCKGEKGSLPEN